MTDYKWWQRAVVYQIYPRSFMDSNQDGVGDLQGIIDKLDYLNDGTPDSLGVDAIWISPFYPSPMADFGYDIAHFTDVDPLFGDLATFDKLVQEAHKRGVRIIVDFIPNHSSDQHPWFIESRSSRDNPKRDWYFWRDPQPDGSLPNNWGACFGGTAWTWDETTRQYYLHQFTPEQPDLNWRNPEVRQAMHDVLRFWMKRGVDGFRMDAVYYIWKHPDLPDQPWLEGITTPDPTHPFAQQQQPYSNNYEGVHDVMKEMRRVLDEYPDQVMIGEIWLPLRERMKYHGNNDEFHMPFNFGFIAEEDFLTPTPWDAQAYRGLVDRYEAALPAGGWPNNVLSNHDVPRVVSRLGGEGRARVAAMMLLTLRGTPTVYMGEELGLPNGTILPHQVRDPQGINLGVERTRDVSRTPFLWDRSPHAGFSAVEPWLPVHLDAADRCLEVQKNQDGSFFNLYRRLIRYRKQSESIAVGSYQSLDSSPGVFVYLREQGSERHLVALNFTDQPQTITLPAAGEIVMDTNLSRQGKIAGSVDLAGDTGLLIRL